MSKNSTHEKRAADAKKKRVIALQMLKRGKTNDQIKDALRTKFGSAIGPDDLATIREKLGVSGPNRGVKQQHKKKAKKAKAKRAKKASSESLVLLQDNGMSARFKAALQTALDQMPAEGIQAFAVTADGLVRVQQISEFMLTPPQNKVLGLLGGRK